MGIIGFLKSWINDIVIMFIFISIIEIILPNSNMKRYIDMIIGLLIIIVIISPFIKLLHKDFNMDKEIFHNTVVQVGSEYKEDSNLQLKQEEQVKKIYIDKIQQEIKDLVHETTNYEVEKMNLSIHDDELNYGDIKNLELILRQSMDENHILQNVIEVGSIEEISIGISKPIANKLIELDKDDGIKNLISKNYNISKENIKVFLNTVGEGD